MLPFYLGPHRGVTRALLLAEVLAEVVHLEDLAQVHAAARAHRAAPCPLDRLVHRTDLPDPEARDDLLGLGERSVHDGRPLEAGPRDAAAVRGGLETLARQQHPRLAQLFVVPEHRVDDVVGRQLTGLGLLVAIHERYYSHDYFVPESSAQYATSSSWKAVSAVSGWAWAGAW